ncbi:methylated-DNA--[protein]-cysteine S-methyltransferase [Pelosinus sp. sgz500959]|uniref:methylated-DNA--[protein]-cysteine S-methyltransferase n=1 Tax=Pelosinus sp. sgz500959 TaxID=3242472 RepID=UPI003673303A
MYNVLETEWGYMMATWTDIGLWELDFPIQDRPIVPESTISSEVELWSEELKRELSMYWRGFAVDFGVPIDWRGYTSFQIKVLKFTAKIPYGQRTTYGDVAQAIGVPKGARATGGALNRNRVPIVIPCHRVIGASGSLTGFGGGIELKQALLLLESGSL